MKKGIPRIVNFFVFFLSGGGGGDAIDLNIEHDYYIILLGMALYKKDIILLGSTTNKNARVYTLNPNPYSNPRNPLLRSARIGKMSWFQMVLFPKIWGTSAVPRSVVKVFWRSMLRSPYLGAPPHVKRHTLV